MGKGRDLAGKRLSLRLSRFSTGGWRASATGLLKEEPLPVQQMPHPLPQMIPDVDAAPAALEHAPAPTPELAPEVEGRSSNSSSAPLSRLEIEGRRLGDKTTQSFQLGATGLALRYAALSQRGYYPDDLFKANQDRFLVMPAFRNAETILLGVFDGHGHEGDHCSNFVRQTIGPELLRQLKNVDARGKLVVNHEAGFDKAYKEAFLAVNKLMHQHEAFDDDSSGTTAITVLMEGESSMICEWGIGGCEPCRLGSH